MPYMLQDVLSIELAIYVHWKMTVGMYSIVTFGRLCLCGVAAPDTKHTVIIHAFLH